VRLCGGAQVFWVSRGKVKPANRQYSAVRNDYTINLDNGCGPPHPDPRPVIRVLPQRSPCATRRERP